MRPDQLRLYLVVGPEQCANRSLSETVREAVRGGVTMVQLRAKTLTDRELVVIARSLREICVDSDIPLIINDRLDIALVSGASGIHLGVDDLQPTDVRELTGSGFIIGYSPDSPEDVRRASAIGVNYLGIGPVFGTATKSDAGSALGLDEFRRRVHASPVPVVGIGGINANNAQSVVKCGAAGVAVVSAITAAPDPFTAARALRQSVGGL